MSLRRGRIVGIAIPLACLMALGPRVGSAAPPTEEPAPKLPATSAAPPRETWRWYGWQTLAADGVAGAIFLVAYADDHNPALFGLSGVSFALGAPAIHVAHGRWAVAMGSLGLRILGPCVGAVIGAGADVRASQDAAGGGDTHGKWTAVGAGLGGVVVSAIDAAILAHDPHWSRPPPPSERALSPLPQLLVLRQGIGLTYSGQF
ncbi:MAG TPA: hypothetical protein VFK05_02265 [Polyangiaceae bacterium]|nr:hypothetical protein [Polyangiaceae bacterium]